MKKQKKRSPSKAKGTSAPAPTKKPKTRRDILLMLRNGGIVAGIAGAGGALLVNSMMATAAEQDLTRIGNGKPAIVQVHDVDCSLCRNLQTEAKAAMSSFDGDRFEYVVANLKSPTGAAFARQHGVSHVTLMLFDRRGNLSNILTGTRGRAELEQHFRRHLRQNGAA
jgi:hypothetical protein